MVLPLLNQPSPFQSNPLFTKSTVNTRRSSPITKRELDEAIKALEKDTVKATKSDDHQALYSSLLSRCIRHKALNGGNLLRAHMVHAGFQPSVFLNNQFINLYSKCRDPEGARQVFDEMPERNIVSWNAMISGYCQNDLFVDALALLQAMVEDGVVPDSLTYISTLRASTCLRDLSHGEQVHALVIKNGFFSSCVEVGNALINFYSKLGLLHDAESVFGSMVKRVDVTWNSLIAGNSQNGNCKRSMTLFVEMQEEGEVPDEFTYGSLMTMEDTAFTEELHALIMKKGLGSNVVVSSSLLDAYGRHGKPQQARQVFNSMTERNTITWNLAISGCIVNDLVTEGIQLFTQMLDSEAIPDDYTISILLKAAITHLSTFTAKVLHGLAFKMGHWQDVALGNTLIVVYATMSLLQESVQAFEDISEPDLISWNSIIQVHLDKEKYELALTFFIEMKHLGFQPDRFSFVAAMEAASALPCHKTGKQIHCNLIKAGLPVDEFVGSSLIDMYAKSIAAENAKKIFDRIKEKDLITWNSMVVGFAQNGYMDEVFSLLIEMKKDGQEPDHFTFASITSACTNTIAIEQGKQVHSLIMKSVLKADTALTNALITMYCRAGSIDDAKKVFSACPQKNVVTWTSMISGYAQSGYSKEAVKLFDQMEIEGVMPNAKTFIILFRACGHGGLIDDAIRYFEMMEVRYGIKRSFDHYACMVDIMGRAGRLEEAEDIINAMPYKPNTMVWRMLLRACRIHGDVERGKKSMQKILSIDPSNSAAFVLLFNFYTALGFHEKAIKVGKLMREKGIKKEAGKSWIEVNNRVHEFIAGDISHSQAEEIYSNLKMLLKPMKDQGYDPGNGILRCWDC